MHGELVCMQIGLSNTLSHRLSIVRAYDLEPYLNFLHENLIRVVTKTSIIGD